MSRKDGTGGRFLRAAERQANCAICGRPIVPGSGRYRTEEGDVHEECYKKRYGRKPPLKACPPLSEATDRIYPVIAIPISLPTP
jgi:hypothetical protein